MSKLKKALANEDVQQLVFLMRALMRRDIMGIDRPALHTVALDGTKLLIEEFTDIMGECLRSICDSKSLSPEQKLSFFRNADVSLGQTALGLSGGGSLGMYHMGVCLALLDANCLPRVITGASGGPFIERRVFYPCNCEFNYSLQLATIITNNSNNQQLNVRRCYDCICTLVLPRFDHRCDVGQSNCRRAVGRHFRP